MANLACLSMHEIRSRNHIPAECLSNSLVSQTDAQDRFLGLKILDQFQGNAGLVRRSWSRRDHNAVRIPAFNFGNLDLIIAVNFRVLAQFSQILDEIIGKRIIVIDYQNHTFLGWSGRPPLPENRLRSSWQLP